MAWPCHVLGLSAGPESALEPLKSPAVHEIIMNMNAVFKFALGMSAIPLLTAQKVEKFPLSSLEGLEPQHLEAESVHYRGRDAIHLSATPKTKGEPIVILTNSDFENGTIEIDLADAPPAGASDSARGQPRTFRTYYVLCCWTPQSRKRCTKTAEEPENGRKTGF